MLIRHIPEENHPDHGPSRYPLQFSEILLELLSQMRFFYMTLCLVICLIRAALSHLYCSRGLGYLGSSSRAMSSHIPLSLFSSARTKTIALELFSMRCGCIEVKLQLLVHLRLEARRSCCGVDVRLNRQVRVPELAEFREHELSRPEQRSVAIEAIPIYYLNSGWPYFNLANYCGVLIVGS